MQRMSLMVALIAASATGAQAWSGSSSDIDRRQYNQERRIEHGRRDGSLNQSEYWRLQQEQRRIQELENAARSDGHIGRGERYAIGRAQREASGHIYRERHDGDGRRWRWWRRHDDGGWRWWNRPRWWW